MTDRIDIADGKYSIINDNGNLTALRYGERWNRDLTGDNLIYWLMVELMAARCAEKRYLFLRSGKARTTCGPRAGRIEVMRWDDRSEGTILKGEELDAAIDAEILT